MQFQRKHAQSAADLYYRHGLHAITATVRSEGVRALYRGLGVRLLYVVPVRWLRGGGSPRGNTESPLTEAARTAGFGSDARHEW